MKEGRTSDDNDELLGAQVMEELNSNDMEFSPYGMFSSIIGMVSTNFSLQI
jgi:phage-related protein